MSKTMRVAMVVELELTGKFEPGEDEATVAESLKDAMPSHVACGGQVWKVGRTTIDSATTPEVPIHELTPEEFRVRLAEEEKRWATHSWLHGHRTVYCTTCGASPQQGREQVCPANTI